MDKWLKNYITVFGITALIFSMTSYIKKQWGWQAHLKLQSSIWSRQRFQETFGHALIPSKRAEIGEKVTPWLVENFIYNLVSMYQLCPSNYWGLCWVFLWLWMSYSMRMILTFLKRALMKVRACSKFQCWKTPILQSFLMLIFIFGFTLILGVQNPMHIFIACVSHWTPAAAQWQTIFTAIVHLHLFKCPLFPSILCYLIL